MRKTIVCLANSYKHGGRCIAGIDIDSGAWIRLHGNSPDGALCACEYGLDDGTEPRLLDVIEVELHYAIPTDSHPEDWHIAPTPWHLVERPANPARLQKITSTTGQSTTIFRDHCDRIAEWELKRSPLNSSLMLVCPTKIHWWIREDRGKRKSRVLFQRNDITYDFSVTDPHWIDKLKLLPGGIYAHTNFASASAETWLTVSVSEAFHGFHYKLVAGVMVCMK